MGDSMCGICGIFEYSDSGVDKKVVQKMCDVVRHRGPDDKGFFFDDNVGLGHRRLSIIDLETGKQPVHNEDESIWIVYNGEIYNYLQLKKQLEKKGHKFYTQTDTEVIVHLYEDLGDFCVKKLRGMFAFAIWDGNKRKLLLARDRLGIKPLYYACNDNLIFGSEIKSILQYPKIRRKVNLKALYYFIRFFYVPTPETLFEGVRKLPPGHVLSCNKKGEISIKEYWDLKFFNEPDYLENHHANRLYDLLKESVQIRLMSDVPLGAFLSGGIDSSFVVGLMSNLMDEPVKTFSVGFEEEEMYAEFKYARIASEQFGTDHHEITVSPMDIVKNLPLLIWHLDEPISDLSIVPFYFVSRLAKKHVTVALSGEGSDELFAGYQTYPVFLKHLRLGKYYQKVPGLIRQRIMSKLFERLPPQTRGRAFFLRNEYASLKKLYFGPNMDFTYERWIEKLYSEKFKNNIRGFDYNAVFGQHYRKAGDCDNLSKMLYGDIKVWLPDDLLLRADKTTMANSVETRVPFLDHRFVEFSATIPYNLKLKGNVTKYILKKTASRLLPKEIIEREKMGFFTPVASKSYWFTGELKELTSQILLESKTQKRGYFNQNYIQELFRQHEKGKRDNSTRIWALLNLELWHRIYIDNNSIDKPETLSKLH